MRLRRLLVMLLCLGLLASGYALWLRAGVGSDRQPVELVISNVGVRATAYLRLVDLDAMLTGYREAGVSGLYVTAATLDHLERFGGMGYDADYPVNLTVMAGAELQELRRLGPGGTLVRDDAAYIFVRQNPDLAAWLQTQLQARLGPERVQTVETSPDRTVLQVSMGREALLQLPLGLFPGDLQLAARYGLQPMVGLTQPAGLPPIDLDVLLRTLPPEPAAVLFYGDEVPGYPDQIAELAAALRRRNDRLVVDGHRPRGLDQLVTAMGSGAVKAYRPWVGERLPDVATAVKDRGFALLLLQPWHASTDAAADLRDHQLYLRALLQRLQGFGFEPGAAAAHPFFRPAAWVLALAALATAAALALLAIEFRLPPRRVAAVAAGGVVLLPAAAVAGGDLGRQAVALLAAVILPALGCAWALAGPDRPAPAEMPQLAPGWADWQAAAVRVAAATGVAVLGGVLVLALLSDIAYTLQLSGFRGVKLQAVAPVFVVAALLMRRRQRLMLGEAGRLAAAQVRMGHLVLLGMAGLAALVLLARTGNTPIIPVTQLELDARAWLEQVLLARPRTKEFVIGYPALVVGLWLLRRRRFEWGFCLVAFGALAPASVANSFAHVYTPFGLTLLRSAHGLWLGLALAGLLLLLIARCLPLCQALGLPAGQVLGRDRHG